MLHYTTTIKTKFWSATVAGGIHEGKLNEDTDLHSHFDEEITICMKGKWAWNMEGLKINMEEGDVVIVPAGIKHRTSRTSETNTRFGVRVRFSRKSNIHLCKDEPVVFHEEAIIPMLRNFNNASPKIKDSLLLLLINMCLDHEERKQGQDMKVTKETRSLLSEIELIIAENYKNPSFGIEKAAKEISLSKREVARICRNRYGKTFTGLLRERRIEAAIDLLNNNAKPTQIFKKVGYSTYVTFYRDYCNLTGKCPSCKLKTD